MKNTLVKKEEFRWSFLKKGKQVLNVCTRMLLLFGFAASMLASTEARANPTGGTVVGGSATITNTPAELQVNQTSQNAIINWNSFNIAAGETTHFYQPNSSATALNRVFNSSQLSAINGNLIANGRVVIINPNGVLIGKGANVNTAGFIATSADIDNNAFMNNTGTLNFNKAGNANASVINQGNITVADTGLVALVAPSVRNDGVIQGNLSKIQLGAADTFGVDFYGDGLINLAVGSGTGNRTITAENNGSIIANGGQVLMTAAAASDVVNNVINNTGVIEANAMDTVNGQIVLKADGATTNVSGTLQANGGSIETSGDYVNVSDNAVVNANDWTIDPLSIKIYNFFLDPGEFNPAYSSVSAGAIDFSLSSGTNVTVSTTGTASPGQNNHGDIIVADDLAKFGGNNATLTLNATGDISFKNGADIYSTHKKLDVALNAGGSITNNANNTVTTNGGDYTAQAGTSVGLAGAVDAGAGTITIVGSNGSSAGDVSVAALTTTSGAVNVSTDNGSVTLNDTVSSGSGDITANASGVLTNFGALTTGGAGKVHLTGSSIALDNNITTAAGTITLDGPVTLGADDTISSTTGAVTFSNTVDGNHSLTVSNAGAVTFSGAIGGTTALNGLSVNGSGAVALNGNAVTNGGNILLTSTGSSVTAQAINANGGNIAVNAATNATLNGTASTSGNGHISVTASTGSGAGNVQTAALTTASGDVTVTTDHGTIGTGNISTTDGSISLTTTTTHGGNISTGDLIVTSSNGYISNNAGGKAVTVSASNGALNLGAVSVVATSTTTGFTDASIALTSGNGDVVTNALTANSTNGGTSSVAVNSAGALTVNGAVSAINVDGGDPAKHSAASATLSAQNDVGISGGVNVASTDSDQPNIGASANLSVTSAHGGVSIGGAVTASSTESKNSSGGDDLTAKTALTVAAKNDIVIGGTVSGTASSTSANNTPNATSTVSVTSSNGDLWLSGSNPSSTANTASETDPYDGTAFNQTSNTNSNHNTAQLILSGANHLYALNITTKNQTKTYGNAFTFDTANDGNDYTVSGLQPAGGSVSSVSLASAGATATANVAGSPYTISGSGATGTYLYNYNINYHNTGTLTVNQAILNLAATQAYNGTTAIASSSFGTIAGVNGQTLTLSGSATSNSANVGTYSTANGNSTHANGLTVSGLTLGNGTGLASNYTLVGGTDTATINPAILNLAATQTYNGTNAIASTSFGTNGTISTGIGGQTLTVGGSATSNSANVGTYSTANGNSSVTNGLTVSGLTLNNGTGLASNYTLVGGTDTATISAALLKITANKVSKTYGTDDSTATDGNVADGAGLSYKETGLVTGDTISGSLTRTAGENVGNYSIALGSLTAGSNYTISFTSNKLNITPANLLIAADNQGKIYGTNDPNFTYTATGLVTNKVVDGVTLNDTISGSLSRDGNIAPGWGTIFGEQVGHYNVTQGTLKAGGNFGNNYNVTVTGQLTINPATLVVTADNKTKTYGTNDPTLTYSETGLVNGVTADHVTIYDVLLGNLLRDGTTSPGHATQAADEQVGDYTINQHTLGVYNVNFFIPIGDVSNYNFTFNTGKLTINPATLTLTANSYTKTYGIDDPTLAYTYSGLVNATVDHVVLHDTLSGSLARDGHGTRAGENAGHYNITQGTVAVSDPSNYSVTFNHGTLTIKPASLTVSAVTDSRQYDGTTTSSGTPTFTTLVNGVVDGVPINDTATGTQAFASANVLGPNGSTLNVTGYTISDTNGGHNYTVTTDSASGTITPAPLTLTVDSFSKPFGQTLTFNGTEFTTSGTLYGSDSVTGVTLSSLGSPALAHPGHYTIDAENATGTGVGNYAITYIPGDLNVRAANLGPVFLVDLLGRPILSVADLVLNYHQYFEPRQTHTLDVDISLRGNGQGGGNGNLANIEPAAGGDDDNGSQTANNNNPNDLANIEPAAGGNGGGKTGNGSFSCANDFLDGRDCTAQ